ncbi:MAG: hypothetical protein KGH89_01920 [Thaumarchaeota archaeon]|nr:hypothetical protein [Nitrososphaerota archaeon]MDE1866088.1 hypothetical protein [Nitrososphaerota archaeon]
MIYKTILLATVILMGYLVVPSYAQSAPEQSLPGESPFAHDFTNIKLLDSYFGYPNQKIEVQPGDKNVPFTMVFSNVGTEDISGIAGFLSLPAQFTPATSAGGVIEADNTQVAPAGNSFTLTFYLNVDKSLAIHDYTGTAKLTYSLVRENGIRQVFFDFDFKLTGKGLLNMKADNPFLQPATNNQVTVEVSNSGTAGLNNVDIVLSQLSNSTSMASNLQNVVIDQHHWNVGTVSSGSSNSYSFNIFVPQDLAGQTLHIPFTLSYFDGQGNQISDTRTVDLIVGPASSTSIIKLSTPSYLMMGVMQNLTLGLQNTSPSKISNISVSITPNSPDFKILQDNKWFIQEINPLTSGVLQIPVFADQNIEGQAVNFDVNIQYTKDGSTVIEKQSFASYIRGVIDVSVYGVQVSEIAGKQMIIGNILNQGNIKGQFGQVTLDPLESSTIKETTQYIGDLDIDAPVPFNVPVDSTSVQLSGDQKVMVTLTYKDTLLQTHTITQVDTVSFGAPAPQSDGSFSQLQLVILVAIAAGIGGIVFKIKKKPKIPVEKTVQETT